MRMAREVTAAMTDEDTLDEDATVSKTILQVERLVKHYGGRTAMSRSGSSLVRAVDGIDFSVHEGEAVGLVGESGSGKSTTAEMIIGLVQPTSGRISFMGHELGPGIDRRKIPEVTRQMQIVFQDPYASLNPRMRIDRIIAEPLKVHGIYTAAGGLGRVHELLEMVGLDRTVADRYPHEFSGGQRQRISIARALATEPKLLVLDEPVSALDVSVQAQVINILLRLHRDMGVSYVFIAHDLAVVRHVCETINVMYRGRIVESGSREQVFGQPQHPYTRQLIASIPIPDPVGREERIALQPSEGAGEASDLEGGCSFRMRCDRAEAVCTEVRPELVRQEPATSSVACHFPGGGVDIPSAERPIPRPAVEAW